MPDEDGIEREDGAEAPGALLADLPAAELLASVADPFFTLDADGCFTWVNTAAEGILGAPAAELQGQRIWERFPWLHGTPFEEAAHRAASTRRTASATMWVTRLEGWFSVQAVPHRAGLSVLLHDVTALKEQERTAARLAATQELLRRVATAVATSAPAPRVHELVCEGAAALAGARWSAVLRFTQTGAMVVGAAGPGHPGLPVVGDEIPRGDGTLDGLREAGAGVSGPARGVMAGWGLATCAAVPVRLAGATWGALALAWSEDEADAATTLGLLDDLAALVVSALGNVEARTAIERQAATDPLTGLANLRTCHLRLDEAVSRAERHGHPLTLALVDVDHFKEVNDGFGHAAGDRLLRLVAQVLAEVGRAEDLPARVGGDEFALVLDGSDPAAALAVAERLRVRVANLDDPDLPPVTASIGLCGWVDGFSRDDLLRCADDALSWVKVHGRDAACVHDPGVMDASRAEQRAAVLRRHGAGAPEAAAGEARLQNARAFWRSTLDALPEHVAVLDERGAILAANEAWLRFAADDPAATARPAPGRDYLAALRASDTPSDARLALELGQVLAGTRASLELEYPLPGADGPRWFVVRANPFHGGRPRRVLVHHEETTDRKLARDRLVQQAQLLHRVPAAVVATTADGTITQWSDGAERLYGYTREQALGAPVGSLLPAEDEQVRREIERGTRALGGWEGEIRLRDREGRLRPVHVQAATLTGVDGGPSGTVTVSVDVSERYEHERDVEAARDYLLAVTSSIADGLLTCDAAGVITYANAAAAELLHGAVTDVVGLGLREAVYRGRDPEPGTPAIDPPTGSARVDDDVFVCADGTALAVTWTSTELPDAGRGRGRVVTFADNTVRKVRELQLRHEAEALRWAARIRAALEDDQFVLFAQPIVASDGGGVSGHELLIRLRDGQGGFVPPGEFLPAAEEHRLMADIDSWVLARAVEIAGTGMPVHVNLSAQSIGDPAVVEQLRADLEVTGTDPALVTVEFTESALITNLEAAQAFAHALRELGCALSLDDFGTGWNSFSRVLHIPVDELKIDMQFVRDVLTHAASESVVKAIVSLAADLDVRTVAEGVEDAATAEHLRALGVTSLQGFFFGRPAALEPVVRPATGLGIHTEEEPDGTTVLALRGELDVHTVRRLRTVLADLPHGPDGLVLDLHDLDFLDSTGLALLLQLPRTAAEEGWPVAYRRPSRAVQSVLAVAGIADLLPWSTDPPR